MLVGRYMVRHFERAEEMLKALQTEHDKALQRENYVVRWRCRLNNNTSA